MLGTLPASGQDCSALQATVPAWQLSNQLGWSFPAAGGEDPHTELCIPNPSVECAKSSLLRWELLSGIITAGDITADPRTSGEDGVGLGLCWEADPALNF